MEDLNLRGSLRCARLVGFLTLLIVNSLMVGCAAASPAVAAPVAANMPAAAVAPDSSDLPGIQFAGGDRPLRFEHISVADGLSQSVVRAILMDRQGFIWIATDDGLNRFDGYNFVVYKNDPDDPHSLGHSQVNRLLEDQQGRLWVGTFSAGLNRFDSHSDTFTRYRHDAQNERTLAANRVNALLEDSSGALWIATNGGLNRFDEDSDSFRRYQNQPGDAHSLGYNNVLALAEDPMGGLWVGTSHGLDRFDPVTEKFSHFTPGAEEEPDSSAARGITALLVDAQGSLWAGSAAGALYRYDAHSNRFLRIPEATADGENAGSGQVAALLQDRSGVIWAGRSGSGLCRLLPGESALACFEQNPADPGSLNAESVLSLYEDRLGIVWVGTYGGGVNKLDPGYKPFENLRADPQNPNSLGGSLIFALYKDRAGALWVGSEEAGLDRVDRRTGQVTHFRHDPAVPGSLSSDRVRTVYQDSNDTLWIGTSAGVDRLDPGASEFVHYRTKKGDPTSLQGSSSGSGVVAISEDRQGTLWMATWEALHRMDRETGNFVHFKHNPQDPQSIASSAITAMAIDSQGFIWLGTMSSGLDRFDPQSETATHFAYNPDDPTSISDAYVMDILEDSSGQLWVGTTGGLNRFDHATGTFQHFRTRDGLPNDFAYAVLEDDQGRLWVSTNKGLSRYDPQTGVFKNFDARDGLQSDEFNMGAGFKSADGELFFGGIQGVTAFRPEAIHDNPYVPPVVLTSLTQHGEPLQPDAEDAITVRWPNNYFDFEFAALNYIRPENNQYAYLLEGFEREWNQIGARHSGRYTNLPGGRYVLRLKGSNNDGLWNEDGAAVVIQVVPPFWATWWFRGASLLLLAGMVTGTVRLRVRGVESRNQELERLVCARTAEIEKLYEQTKELALVEERNRLARDLHDSAKQKAFAALAQLGAANGLFRSDPQRARVPLAEAETLVYEVIEELTFLIQEMYPVELIEKGLANMLREYIFEWESRSDMSINFQIENECRLALQAEQALYRIVQEGLANVARHSRANQVSVCLHYAPQEVILTITDDGQGFDLARRAAGVGLRSMRERAALLDGELTVESAPGKGTRITACIPAREDAAPRASAVLPGARA